MDKLDITMEILINDFINDLGVIIDRNGCYDSTDELIMVLNIKNKWKRRLREVLEQ